MSPALWEVGHHSVGRSPGTWVALCVPVVPKVVGREMGSSAGEVHSGITRSLGASDENKP